MDERKNILLLYPYYWPHYKAGGPVQSLYNLAGYFATQANFFIVSLDRDFDGQPSTPALETNKWVKGPQGECLYFTSRITPSLLFRLVREVQPEVFFINGIFNLSTTLPGIFLGKLFGKKVIISPRGMLQGWALKRNRLVKKTFLFLMRFFLIRSGMYWHATDEQERKDIMNVFGSNQRINIALNIPRPVSGLENLPFPGPDGKIKLVFLSLINPNKNLHLVIEQVQRFHGSFQLDVYGPIIDKTYWLRCVANIENEQVVSYKGAIPSWNVPDVLRRYHFFILPTEGENFGHAIFDALSAGVPVIISKNTPWTNIDVNGAGYYFDSLTSEGVYRVLRQIGQLTQDEYDNYRNDSIKFATMYRENNNYDEAYGFLFEKKHIVK